MSTGAEGIGLVESHMETDSCKEMGGSEIGALSDKNQEAKGRTRTRLEKWEKDEKKRKKEKNEKEKELSHP